MLNFFVYYIILYYVILYYIIMLYYVILYYISYYIILYYITYDFLFEVSSRHLWRSKKRRQIWLLKLKGFSSHRLAVHFHSWKTRGYFSKLRTLPDLLSSYVPENPVELKFSQVGFCIWKGQHCTALSGELAVGEAMELSQDSLVYVYALYNGVKLKYKLQPSGIWSVATCPPRLLC
jgi:hypothetical protein